MASGLLAEVRKIPPVTRFMCMSSLAVTVPMLLGAMSGYRVLFVKELVWRKLELWRVYTTFFVGRLGIGYIFELFMLYRNSVDLESSRYLRTPADYTWQLIITALTILALNIPLQSMVHTRPFILSLVYISSSLASPGAQTSLFGLVTFPVIYLPYVLLGLDFLEGGPNAVVTGITGLIAGHLWWWGVWGGVVGSHRANGALIKYARAPRWLHRIIGGDVSVGPPEARQGYGGGVRVIPPRRPVTSGGEAISGHKWGSGQRLGG